MKTHHIKLFNFLSLLICSIFLLFACSDNKLTIKTEYRPVAFDSLKTYRWYEKSSFDEKGAVSEITYAYIKQAIDKELKAKQLSKTSDVAVDFYVNVTVTAEMRVDVKDYQVYSGVGEGYRYSRDTGFQSSFSSEQKTDYIYYRDGTLLVDIIDPFSDKLIWRGVAKKRLPKEKKSSQQKREKMIDQAISAVLADFPPDEK